jgi:hypothetical protein
MDIFFEIFRTSNPAITEEEYEIPITIDIFGMNGNFSNDIYLIDMDSCFLKHGSHYYFLRRSEKSRHWPLYWGFPGGKMEIKETLFEAALTLFA